MIDRVYDTCSNLPRFDGPKHILSKHINFSTEMTGAVLEGRKTQVRRIIKSQPKMQLIYNRTGSNAGTWTYLPKDICEYRQNKKIKNMSDLTASGCKKSWTSPYRANDVIYVKETFSLFNGVYVYKIYKASDNSIKISGPALKWTPSVHMPKEAARIFLRVKRVSVERLQDIGRADCINEGIKTESSEISEEFARSRFRDLWNSTLKPKNIKIYGWDANPWIWKIEFEKTVL